MDYLLPAAVGLTVLLIVLGAFLLARSRKGQKRVTREALAPPRLEAPPASPLARLTQGLGKSRRQLAQYLGSIVVRDRLDDEAWDEIEEALIRADVGVRATEKIVERLRQKGVGPAQLMDALRTELVAILERGDREFSFSPDGPSVWLVVGVNGSGKTTSIAKLAARLSHEGRRATLAAADTFRAAAIDQLESWAERVGMHVVRHQPGADPSAVVFDAIEHARARGIDVVIVDTAGRLHTKSNLMDELSKIKRVAERQAGPVQEVLLVLDATVGQNGIAQARTFREAVEVTGVLLTKLDGTARGGIVVAIQEELGVPVKAVGIGEGLDDLESFDPEVFVDALLD